ncbi:MAG: S41 family peptidase [Planctomycetota bacterium]|jgi:carboxyl-terminal processing protease
MRKMLATALLLPLLLTASSRPAEGAELSKEGKRALKYIKAVHKGIRAYHIDGGKHAKEVYVKAAWEAMIRVLEAKKFEGLDQGKAQILIEALRRAKMADLDRLIALLDRFASRIGGMDVEKLAEIGAKGMFIPLQDPFSTLMDMKRLQKLMQMMSSTEDRSLGLSPTRTPEKEWKIAHVRNGYPAYDAGLKIGDRILSINGKPIDSIPPTDVMELMKADEGEALEITVNRKGWSGPHTFEIVQRKTKKINVETRMLPGKIGYMRVLIFNMTMAKDVEKGLVALEEKGMKALILDLRGNPGGALPACVSVADKFLEGGKVIATMKTHHPFMAGTQTYRTRDKGTHPRVPMAVLIDKASASASEMLSGALKMNKRAVVIGETSYGKGVGQSVMPVGAKLSHHTSPQFFYITLMEYFLPGKIVVHHKGVVPDIEVKPSDMGSEVVEKLWALRKEGILARYVENALKRDEKKLEKAVGFSSVGFANLPGLVETFQRYELGLPPEIVKAEIFRTIRNALDAKAGAIRLLKPKEDPVLCRAVYELCKELEITPKSVPEYRFVFRTVEER